jgi:uncharacterized protein
MMPFFFGTGARRLFGIHSAAHSGRALRPPRGVVLCNPWGYEYQFSHRSIRYLASSLAEAGIHVLRFDYFGTGDSDGDASDASFADWIRDIESAIEELRDAAALTRVSLVGLRLGALLAARVASSDSSKVEQLVLWDPVVSGEDYLKQIGRDEDPQPTSVERRIHRSIGGFAISDVLEREIQSQHLQQAITGFRGRALAIVSERDTPASELESAKGISAPGAITLEKIDGPPVWQPERGLGVGAIPIALVARVVEWLTT